MAVLWAQAAARPGIWLPVASGPTNPTRALRVYARRSGVDAWLCHREISGRCMSTAKGFEPLRAEPNGFLVHHLNHSVALS